MDFLIESVIPVLLQFCADFVQLFTWEVNVAGMRLNLFLLVSIPILIAVLLAKLIQLFIK